MSKVLGIKGSDSNLLEGMEVQAGILKGFETPNYAQRIGAGARCLNLSQISKEGTKARILLPKIGNVTDRSAIIAEIQAGSVTSKEPVVDIISVDVEEKNTEMATLDFRSMEQLQERQGLMDSVIGNKTKAMNDYVNREAFKEWARGVVLNRDGGSHFARTISANADAVIQLTDADLKDSTKKVESVYKVTELVLRLMEVTTPFNKEKLEVSDMIAAVSPRLAVAISDVKRWFKEGTLPGAESMMTMLPEMIVTNSLPTGWKMLLTVKGGVATPFAPNEYLDVSDTELSDVKKGTLGANNATITTVPEWLFGINEVAAATAPMALFNVNTLSMSAIDGYSVENVTTTEIDGKTRSTKIRGKLVKDKNFKKKK